MVITPIIGLEIHVELKTKSKMFCGCDASHFHADPNTHTCPVCLGLPGALPVPNKTAIDWDIKLGLALGCTINKFSFFERKNYFYPDLPKGYQITQLQKPFAVNGHLKIDDELIRINRAHMEEDTGKSQHLTIDMFNATLIDYNRSGVPLVEIVSEPDIHSSDIAKKYLLKIQQIVRYLGISDADIDKGSMRCEPTINLKIDENGQTFYTPLAEIKNIASLTGAQNAIDFEIKRQYEDWKATGITKAGTNLSEAKSALGGKTTRGWDAVKNHTFLQREKEGSADYRYFPEPDIPPIEFTDDQIAAIKSTLPELPDEKIARYQKDFGLSDYDATVLAADIDTAAVFDHIVTSNPTPQFAKFTANLILGPIKTYLNDEQKIITNLNLDALYFSQLFAAIQANKVSNSVAKQLIVDCYLLHQSPLDLAESRGLIQVSDTAKIEAIAQKVLADNPKAVADYQKNPASIGFLIGQLMRASAGSANPQLAKEILLKLLS